MAIVARVWQVCRHPQVAHYAVYLVNSADDSRSQVSDDKPLGTNAVDIAPEFPQGVLTDISVFTRSTLFEQTTPATLLISDTSSTPEAAPLFENNQIHT